MRSFKSSDREVVGKVKRGKGKMMFKGKALLNLVH